MVAGVTTLDYVDGMVSITESPAGEVNVTHNTAAPVSIGISNAEGTGQALARSDHLHNHDDLSASLPNAHHNKLHAMDDAAHHSSGTLGDTLYAAAAGAWTRLQGNLSTTPKLLGQTGDGAASAAPSWVGPGANPAEIEIGDATAEGTATTWSRSDHQHQLSAPDPGYPQDVAAAEAEGTATSPARADHVHAYGWDDATSNPLSVDATAAADGTENTPARKDHRHQLGDHDHTGSAGGGGKLTAPVHDSYDEFENVAAPAAPAGASVRLYNFGGNLWFKNVAATYPLSGLGSYTIDEADIGDGKMVVYRSASTDLGYAAVYTDEKAQDAVGTILVDGTGIDLTYTDATPEITAAITSAFRTHALLAFIDPTSASTSVSKATIGPLPFAGTFVKATLKCVDGETNGATAQLVDIHKQTAANEDTDTSTTVFTTQANRPTITNTHKAGSTTTFDVTTFAKGDYLYIFSDQLGTGLTGLYVTIEVTQTS